MFRIADCLLKYAKFTKKGWLVEIEHKIKDLDSNEEFMSEEEYKIFLTE